MIDEDRLQAFDAANPMHPYVVSTTATQRRSGTTYVSGLALTPFERMCCRGRKCWVAFEDDTGWKVVLYLGTGYWFHAPPANLLRRLLARNG